MSSSKSGDLTPLTIPLGIEDDVARRDNLHAIINDLPDPNYATLRALVLV